MRENRILFAADRHYGAHPGRALYEEIREHYDIDFFEDDWSCFERNLKDAYDLIILNMISGSCDVPPPSDRAAPFLKGYLESGSPLLLLGHGSRRSDPADYVHPHRP